MGSGKRQQRLQLAAVLTVIPLFGVATWLSQPRDRPDLAGTLNNDVVAIGGETTGWGITRAGEGSFVEVDISAVKTEAAALCGKPVHAWGQLRSAAGVERGGHDVFVITKLAAAK